MENFLRLGPIFKYIYIYIYIDDPRASTLKDPMGPPSASLKKVFFAFLGYFVVKERERGYFGQRGFLKVELQKP
jgi:hypothetical protein